MFILPHRVEKNILPELSHGDAITLHSCPGKAIQPAGIAGQAAGGTSSFRFLLLPIHHPQILLDLAGGVVAEVDEVAEFVGEVGEGHDDLAALGHQGLALLVGDAAHLAEPSLEVGIGQVELAQDGA